MYMRAIVTFFALRFYLPLFLSATDYTSSNFIVRDPVISDGGSRSTSNSFELYSSVGQIAAGTSTSSNFGNYVENDSRAQKRTFAVCASDHNAQN